jgi:hypothetical protein
MENVKEKDISIFDFLPKVLPILDLIFIIWVAICSPAPWITTPIHILQPLLGLASIKLFKDKGRPGFYAIGIVTSIPIALINLWGSPDCPTWLACILFIVGGMMMAITLTDQFVVLTIGFVSTIVPLLLNSNSINFIVTVCVTLLSVWFLMERCVKFMEMQKQLIGKQKKEVEEKQKEIIDSIRYARRIQHSLLPTEKYLDKQLNKLK